MGLSTRTMNNGLNKISKTIGCTLEQGMANLPGFFAGSGPKGTSPQVGYAHFCGDALIEPYVPPPPTPEPVAPVVVDPIVVVDPVIPVVEPVVPDPVIPDPVIPTPVEPVEPVDPVTPDPVTPTPVTPVQPAEPVEVPATPEEPEKTEGAYQTIATLSIGIVASISLMAF